MNMVSAVLLSLIEQVIKLVSMASITVRSLPFLASVTDGESRRHKIMLYGILLGLVCALCWGTADIFATVVARRLGTLTTLFFSHMWGLLFVLILLAFTWRPLALTPQALLLSLPAGLGLGVLLAIGYFAFYRGLELGPLAIVSPLTSADGAIAVLLAILFLHESLGVWQGSALLILFLGIVLVSLEGTSPVAFFKTMNKSVFAKGGTKWGLVAMIVFGLVLFGTGAAAQMDGWFLPIFWMRICSALIVASVRLLQQWRLRTQTISVQHTKYESTNSWLIMIGFAAVAGLLDTAGHFLYSFNTHIVATGIAAAVGSCFVLLPLLYGAFVLREKLAIHQTIGVGLVLVGLILLGYNSV